VPRGQSDGTLRKYARKIMALYIKNFTFFITYSLVSNQGLYGKVYPFVSCGIEPYLQTFTHRGTLLARADLLISQSIRCELHCPPINDCLLYLLRAISQSHSVLRFHFFKNAPRSHFFAIPASRDTPSPSASHFTVPLGRKQVPTGRGT
jgi:hypothetical protein